ncbi:MAG TPA: septal ring lytic transglycosylase RlpA family protein [Methyloceanibacter sp.]|nr:septal ring lytic transglycosylase RlpA family protein [Methyloceanibacter sp.]
MFKMRAKIISVGLLGTAAMLPLDFAKADQVGHASWYSLPANTTANGERMDPDELTAAHRSLPFGTRVLVENLTNGRSVIVRINDRGPFIGGRIIDLSKAAAESIGMLAEGTAQVRITTTAPDGGSALASLGEATAKEKQGVALAAKETAAAEPHQVAKASAPARVIEAKNHTKTAKPTVVASLSPVKAKTKVAFASTKTRKATADHGNQTKVAVAWEPPRYSKKMARIAAKSARTHVAVSYSYKPAARGSSRGRFAVASVHPYAVFAGTPGFMQPAAS